MGLLYSNCSCTCIIIQIFYRNTNNCKTNFYVSNFRAKQRLWLNRWGRTTKTLPKRGEIITFEEPSKVSYNENEINQENPVAQFEQRTGWNWFVNNFLEMGKKRSYIKRVIALPGEHVKIENGKVYINGNELEEKYLQAGVVTDVIGVRIFRFYCS